MYSRVFCVGGPALDQWSFRVLPPGYVFAYKMDSSLQCPTNTRRQKFGKTVSKITSTRRVRNNLNPYSFRYRYSLSSFSLPLQLENVEKEDSEFNLMANFTTEVILNYMMKVYVFRNSIKMLASENFFEGSNFPQ